MPAAVAAYNVGGMGAYWTATTLRQHPTLERSPLIPSEEWEELYSEAECLLNANTWLFDFSIRHSVVEDTVLKAYSDTSENFTVQKVPYAGQRDPHCPSDIQWTGVDVILGEKLMEMLSDSSQTVFRLEVSLEELHCGSRHTYTYLCNTICIFAYNYV